jgi:hypothetical protein
MTISASTAPGEILMITIAAGETEQCETIEPTVAVIDLDADERVLGIEVLDRSKFDLDAVAAEYGIEMLVPEIRAAISTAKPGP